MKSFRFFLFFSTICFYLVSCQKEIDIPEIIYDVPGEEIGAFLVKMISSNGKDSVITTYSYDANGKVSSKKEVSNSGVRKIIISTNNYRDHLGRIIKIEEIVQINSSKADTVNTYISYANTATTNWSHSIKKVGLMGITTIDSIAYGYDNSGNLTTATSYSYPAFQSTPPTVKSKLEFFYDGNKNLIERNDFDNTAGSLKMVLKYKYSYDTNVNPLAIGSLSVLLDIMGGNSKHNISKIEKFDFKNSLNSYVSIRNYKLNSNGTPNSCNETYEKGTIPTNYNYYYN